MEAKHTAVAVKKSKTDLATDSAERNMKSTKSRVMGTSTVLGPPLYNQQTNRSQCPESRTDSGICAVTNPRPIRSSWVVRFSTGHRVVVGPV